MKLNLFFIAMDLITLLVYPILFLRGKLRQFAILKDGVTPDNSLVTVGR